MLVPLLRWHLAVVVVVVRRRGEQPKGKESWRGVGGEGAAPPPQMLVPLLRWHLAAVVVVVDDDVVFLLLLVVVVLVSWLLLFRRGERDWNNTYYKGRRVGVSFARRG